MDAAKVEGLVRELLREIGEDPAREGLLQTPARVARALAFLTSGYRGDAAEVVHRAVFAQPTNHMVIARDIELYSLCEHHLLPFFGRAHIGYVAQGRVIGVSKLARLVDHFARRLQIQERLTEEVAGAVQEAVKADGVGVVVEAQHLCMMMRGVEKQNSMMTTSAVLGSFRRSTATRAEFLTLIGRRHL
ncbi:GTP cyclohydrolase I FolE [Anaeromyxobacter diazotrophicus]|uniref:GTP cyclohydrolase 1 n=1 Tax=Anaeromyxobacter diazotrophicus TaxID=2590199 RepID=A0A7I9VP68_9BACT|nr:GTP cyclohydrolase I FolE [Anaeromyxobacter diazotrophicus]GEJ58202.1 GTP cyclohydrolase 1 [Anaeromyxobacter diazotrophicus]